MTIVGLTKLLVFMGSLGFAGYFAMIAHSAEPQQKSIWLESLGDQVPDEGDIPDGLRLVPVGLRMNYARTPIPPRKARLVSGPGVYQYVTETFIISPERAETIITPEVWKNGKLITPERRKTITHPPVFESRTTKQLVRPGKTYETLTQDIPKVRITRRLANIKGYALVDARGTRLRTSTYHEGKLLREPMP